MIEMGVLTNVSFRKKSTTLPARVGSATAATHVEDPVDGTIAPLDCDQLVRNWTDYATSTPPDPLDGMWFREAAKAGNCTTTVANAKLQDDADCKATDDTVRNTGGLFGTGAIINAANGTMFSYDPKAVQGFDKSDFGMHYIPGTTHPSFDAMIR